MHTLTSLALVAATIAISGLATAQAPCFEPNFGPSVGTGDDFVLPVQAIGFAFPFNGSTYTNLFPVTNGFVYLSNAASTTGGNGCCAGSSAGLVASPDPIVAPFWSDLNAVSSVGSVNFTTNASRCVVTWSNVYEFGHTTPFTVQLQLYASGEIVMFFGTNMVVTTHVGLTGMSPGNGATLPPASNYSSAPFITGNTSFQLWNNTAPNLLGSSIDFLPAGSNQYVVTILNCAAANTAYGQGCIQHYASFYENFAAASSFDLNNVSMTLLATPGGYVALSGIASYRVPSASAAVLALGDDTAVAQALSSPFPYPGGVSSSLTVCSNGFVSMTPGNTTTFVPSVATMLSAAQTAYYCWHDFNPAATGSGTVKFEEISGVAYITWDGVWDFAGTSSANANTWQLQFDETNGNVTWAWQTMSTLGGTGFLVGYSPAGPSADPGSLDISVALPTTFTVANTDVLPLALAASPSPVLGNTVVYTTSNVPANALVTGLILGFGQVNPGTSLAAIGAPGCFQYINLAGSTTVLLFGTPSVTQSLPIPNNATYVGLQLFVQSASLVPGVNPLGLLTSNGIKSYIQAF
jgi:hypothetical protein